jgi:hypothetical protein
MIPRTVDGGTRAHDIRNIMNTPNQPQEPLLEKSTKTIKCAHLAFAILASLLGATATTHAEDLDPEILAKAISYMGVLRGEAIPAQHEAWLIERWQDAASSKPEKTAAEVDHLAVLFEQHQKTGDALALANGRADFLKNVYCTAAQTSDPDMARLADILVPGDLVLAADCALGLVVTRFDIEGLVASHRLVAGAVDQDHDAGRDVDETAGMIKGWFPDAPLSEKESMARAEIRHAVLVRFWDRIDGSPGQGALIDAIRSQAADDLEGPARELESLAVSKLGEVDYLAKVGEALLKPGVIGSYIEFFERVAGQSLATRDRWWVQDAIVGDFRDDPAKLLANAEIVQTNNRNYRATSSAEERAAMLSEWAANLYCLFSASDGPEGKQLLKILFRHDPVTDASCDPNRISRKSATVLAEGEGRALREGDLVPARRFASTMLGRELLPDEQKVLREYKLQGFERDVDRWGRNQEFYQTFLAKIDQRRDDSVFLAMDERKTIVDSTYCALKASDEPLAADYVRMFQREGAILYEDCDRELVTTREEVDAFISVLDFLALINGKDPLSQTDIEGLRERLAPQNMSRSESMQLALREWWSLLTVAERATAIKSMREQGITPEADAETLRGFIDHVERMVVVLNAKSRSCESLAVTIQGMTAIYGASLGPGVVTGNSPSGIPGEQLAGLASADQAARAICRGVFGG